MSSMEAKGISNHASAASADDIDSVEEFDDTIFYRYCKSKTFLHKYNVIKIFRKFPPDDLIKFMIFTLVEKSKI